MIIFVRVCFVICVPSLDPRQGSSNIGGHKFMYNYFSDLRLSANTPIYFRLGSELLFSKGTVILSTTACYITSILQKAVSCLCMHGHKKKRINAKFTGPTLTPEK